MFYSEIFSACPVQMHDCTESFNACMAQMDEGHVLPSFWALWTSEWSKMLRANWIHSDQNVVPNSWEAICELVAA